MITIEDIEALNPGNHIAAEYSDLYKAVYGSRPYGELVWESVEDFDKDWNFLIKQLNEEEERAIEQEKRDILKFIAQVDDYLVIFPRASKADIIRYIAQAEDAYFGDVDKIDYGYLEYKLGLPYNYIQDTFLKV